VGCGFFLPLTVAVPVAIYDDHLDTSRSIEELSLLAIVWWVLLLFGSKLVIRWCCTEASSELQRPLLDQQLGNGMPPHTLMPHDTFVGHAELQRVFDAVDEDGSGSLDLGELSHLLELLGIDECVDAASILQAMSTPLANAVTAAGVVAASAGQDSVTTVSLEDFIEWFERRVIEFSHSNLVIQ
jgi:hypothetical protein